MGTLVVLGLLLPPLFVPPPAFAQDSILEDFESFAVGDTPIEGWGSRGGDPLDVYTVQEEGGNRYLRASDRGGSVILYRRHEWKLAEFPFLRWKWRVHEFPVGADERNPETNDSAASVTVIFKRGIAGKNTRSVKYVWSEAVSVGTSVRHKDKYPMIVLRSGATGAEDWQTETRNVWDDYREFFGESEDTPDAIGFRTDSDAVKGSAQADYDDIEILSATAIQDQRSRSDNPPIVRSPSP